MMVLFGIFYFLLGTVIGSFLNVVVLRHNTGRTLSGRSQCFSCGEVLGWRDLVPVLSFLAARGRCRSCSSRISLQYPVLELITGMFFLGVFLKFSHFIDTSLLSYFLHSTFYILIMSLLMIILVYDIRHKIIPNAFVYSFIALSLISVFGILDFKYLNLLAGPILALPFAALWFVSRGTWMGLGDAKLALGIGWLLGFTGGLSAILLSFWIGAASGVALLFISSLCAPHKHFTMKSAIPFAPFLVIGFLLVFFFDIRALTIFQ